MIRYSLLFIFATSLFACADSATDGNNDDNNTPIAPGCVDEDNDGYDAKSSNCLTGDDCNDNSAAVSPFVKEVCGDKIDNDCDNIIDENCGDESGCLDVDDDGYGVGEKCLGTDCDDTNSAINPGAQDICGNNIAENCKEDLECTGECLDEDGDQHGVGDGCHGPDCDDTDPNINPRADDICGNDVAEDCKADLPCSVDCLDADKDGYGREGSTGCRESALDCDDTDAKIFPGAQETCNGEDDNCDGETDECPGEGQACASGRCVGGVGSPCEDPGDCVGVNVTCDTTQSPKECRSGEGGSCTDVDQCVSGLACTGDTCSGNFCDSNTCTGATNICDRTLSACVECEWTNRTEGDAQCMTGGGNEVCATGGFCGKESPLPFLTWADVYTINIDIAKCWLDSLGGVKRVCWTYTSDNTINSITETQVYNAWDSGIYDANFSVNQIGALDDVWGKGIFDVENMDWRENLTPNMDRNMCMWYSPGTFLDEIVVDLCENFTP